MMKRPFLLIGGAGLTASFLAAETQPITIALLLLVGCVISVLLTVKYFTEFYRGAIVALIFILLAVRIFTLLSSVEAKNLSLAGRTAEVTGRVTEIVRDEDNYSIYCIKVEESTNPEAENIKLKAALFYNAGVSAGDRVTATVIFEITPLKYRLSDYSKGFYYTCEIEKVSVTERGTFTVWRLAHDMRNSIRKAIGMSGSTEATALLNALIIGDTSGISADFMNSVKNTGVSHMLVVSGMHLGIVCGMLMRAMSRKTGRVMSALIGIVSVGFVTVVCLFHVSILRASIAYFVMLVGKLIFRNADSLSSLGFGVAAAVFAFPYIFYNVAFLLSIAATFAVIYPGAMLTDIVSFQRFGKAELVFKYIWETFVISVCALFCTLPIVGYYFGYVAAVSPISNVAVTFAINAALILGAVATAVYFIPIIGVFCCVPLYFAAKIFIFYFIYVIRFIGESGIGVINVSEDKNIYCFLIAVAFILLVKALCFLVLRRKERKFDAQRQNP